MSILPELTTVAEAGFDETFARKAILKRTLDKIAAMNSAARSYYVNTDSFSAFGVVAMNNSENFENSELSNLGQPALMEV